MLTGCGRRRPVPAQRAEATEPATKPIRDVLTPGDRHWVGDGFDVRTAFSPRRYDPQQLSPFILLDHASARRFDPAAMPRGVGEHPHRGFETVTFAYQGEIDHRDSHGGGGTIGPGDVQWMTAARGVVHEEMHSRAFTQRGGTLEMVQLWVNLPARDKMSTPRYQALSADSFPTLRFGATTGRLIAGELEGARGSAETHTPMTIFDLTLRGDAPTVFEPTPGHTCLALVLQGEVRTSSERTVRAGELIVFDRDQPGRVELASADARALVLSGRPLGEPVVAHGPFVMNSREEIQRAYQDFRMGQMGTLRPTG